MASTVTLHCDQAIFTSVRGPMGEGYRIIASSKGLRPEEKQAITRSSPSHDSLCPTADGPRDNDAHVFGSAFYPLPTGRLCVAYSCFAGAEHTGRGGQRVYTLILCMSADQFAAVKFNAFHVIRAMHQAGLTQPDLSPPQVLPELDLCVEVDDGAICGGTWCRAVSPAARRYLLGVLLDEESAVVNLNTDWLDAAEGLILGVPGPMRARISWAAGLKFSIGRGHRLHLLHDATPATKGRTAGQRVEFVEPGAVQEPPHRSSWVTCIERYWEGCDMSGLSRRTSRAFRETTPEARERVARLFLCLDDLPKTETARVLSLVGEHLVPRGDDVDRAIGGEFLEAAGVELTRRFTTTPWNQVSAHWPTLLDLAKRSPNGAQFACPIIEKALRTLLRSEPLAAARAALPLAHFRPPMTPAAASGVLATNAGQAARAPVPAGPVAPPGLPTSPYLRRMLSNTKVAAPAAVPAVEEAGPAQPAPAIPRTWDGLIDEVLTRLLQSLDYAADDLRAEIAAVVQPWRSARPTSAIVRQLAERAGTLSATR